MSNDTDIQKQLRKEYEEQGYVVLPGLFSPDEAAQMIDHYMELRKQGPKPGDFGGTADQANDPTHKYPRFIQMQKWDDQSAAWANDERILSTVQTLIGDKPVLNQTMLYFKPPGGRGQGLHQDQQYITIEPLIGVWLALDVSDAAVGQMQVVPGSHKLGMLKVEKADTSVSFTPGQTVLPAGANVIGLDMQPGDVLFFHGKTVHGSQANTTSDRFRRSFICHYVGEHAEKFEPEQGTHVTHVQADV